MDAQDRARDFISAILFMAIGVGAVAMALGWPLGDVRRIGPGALPLMVGGLMIAVGLGLALQAWFRGRAAGPLLEKPSLPQAHVLRAVVFVTLSLIVFALLVRPLGLFVATAALALVARQAEPGASLVGSVVLALALATLSAAIFVYAIGLPFRVWP